MSCKIQLLLWKFFRNFFANIITAFTCRCSNVCFQIFGETENSDIKVLIVSLVIFNSVPFHPAWIAATIFLVSSNNKIGTQSAVVTLMKIFGVAEIKASPLQIFPDWFVIIILLEWIWSRFAICSRLIPIASANFFDLNWLNSHHRQL